MPSRQRNVSSLPGSPPTGGWRCSGQSWPGEEDELLRADALGVHVDDDLQADLLEPAEAEVGDLDSGALGGVRTMPARSSIAAARSRASSSRHSVTG